MVKWAVLVVLLAFLTQAPALPMMIDPTNKTCSDSLHQFLSRISTHVNQSDFQLHVELPPIDPTMESLCQTSNYSLELWRVIDETKSSRPQNFGTKDYFGKYQRCERPNPDLLWMHGESVLVEGRAGGEKIMFQHVIAKEYVLRMCSCLGGHSCSCLIDDNPPDNISVVCSQLINVNKHMSSDLVFDWCKEGKLDENNSPQATFLTPVIQHCPSKIRLEGTLASCSPVRHYDMVQIVLQPFPKGDGIPDCGQHLREIGKNAGILSNKMVQKVQLQPKFNGTHGTFSTEISNVTLDTYYCLQAELVNHPYCNSASVGPAITRKLPNVCRPMSMRNPILMEAHTCPNEKPSCHSHNNNLPLVIGCGVAGGVAVCIVIILIVARFCRKRSPSSRNDLAISDKLLATPPSHQCPDILFLYFEDCTELVAVNSLLGQWMVGLGHKVIDLADSQTQEEMAGSPEVWLTDRIEDPDVKVVVVKSKAADLCLEAEGGDGGGSLAMSRLDRPRDAMDPLRVFSLRHIQARLAGNYRRLAVLQCWEGSEGPILQLVPHTRYVLPAHLPELQAWLADTASYDGNDNLGGGREQTLKDLKAAVYNYCNSEMMITKNAKL